MRKTPFLPLDFACPECRQRPGLPCFWLRGKQKISRRAHSARVLLALDENAKRRKDASQDPHGS